MYSTKLSVSIHILTVIALMEGQAVTSEYIASSINTNPALVRRLMSRLRKATLITASPGLGVTGLAKKKKILRFWISFSLWRRTPVSSASTAIPITSAPWGRGLRIF